MNIRTPKNWVLPESAVTAESVYRRRNRRDFLKTLGVASVGLIGGRALYGATAGFPAKENPLYPASALKPTPYDAVTSYNNFYEFGTDKSDPKENAKNWKTEPWTVELSGLIRNPGKFDVNDLIGKLGGIEERVYRHRCVEAWSMVVPWDGFPLAKLVAMASPTADAKFVKLISVNDPTHIEGQRRRTLDWPYVEGLRLDEAMNELSFIATGIYGQALPNQNGAPLRLVTPWKYGFKGIKSIVKIEFTATQPQNTWYVMAPDEYGFYANVNPNVSHPRWSQASERVIGSGVFAGKQRTLMFNGYEKEVAGLYAGLDLKRNY